jgi:hypothetical protein
MAGLSGLYLIKINGNWKLEERKEFGVMLEMEGRKKEVVIEQGGAGSPVKSLGVPGNTNGILKSACVILFSTCEVEEELESSLAPNWASRHCDPWPRDGYEQGKQQDLNIVKIRDRDKFHWFFTHIPSFCKSPCAFRNSPTSVYNRAGIDKSIDLFGTAASFFISTWSFF